jgi:6-phosphogluconolactonase (cycloisomerase 2 family)
MGLGPRVRAEGLLVQRLECDELVVVDERAQRAHALSGASVGVWGLCDGSRSLEVIAGELSLEVEMVERVLSELAAEGLLADESALGGLIDRRRVLLGAAAVSVPLMMSIGVPAAYASASNPMLAQAGSVGSTAGIDAPVSVAFSPSGTLLAVANANASSTVEVFTVSSSGVISSPAAGSVDSGAGVSRPYSVAFSPSGTLLAVANYGASTVEVFTVDSSGVISSAAAGSVGSTAGINEPYSVAFSPSGTLLAVANYSASTVEVFAVSLSGVISSPAAQSVGSGAGISGPVSVAFSPSGTLLAVANDSASTVEVFTV